MPLIERPLPPRALPPLLPFFEKEKKNFREFRNIFFPSFSPPLFLTDRRRKGRGGAGVRQIQNSSKFWKSPLLPRYLSTPLSGSRIIRSSLIRVREEEGGGSGGSEFRPIRFDRILTSWERERERKGERREGGSVPLSPRANYSPLLSRPWPSKWPCNVTVNSITIGRAAQVTETGSARGKGERERERGREVVSRVSFLGRRRNLFIFNLI